ncbi:MAG: non-ribosomal peptide synthetase, partial [Leptolyngbya foveolarum]
KTSAFQTWAQKLQTYATSAELEQETGFWLEMLEQPVVPLPTETPTENESTAEQLASRQPITLEFNPSETQFLLQHSAQIYDAQLHEILLTVLLLSLQQWTGQSACLIDLEGHGRESLFPMLDVSRTLGWFTTVYPAYLRLDASDFDSALQGIKSQLQTVRQHGIHYGLLRYLASPPLPNVLKALPQASILFNYLGKFDLAQSQWALYAESSGAAYSAQNHRNYTLEINGLVTQGCLQLTWAYDECLHSHNTIAALAQAYREQLRSLIPPNYQPEEKAMPTEFAWTGLNSADVDAILDTVEFEGNES